MKTLGLLVAMLLNGPSFSEDQVDHTRPFTPEEEEAYFTPYENGVLRKRNFPYRFWNECSQPISGNYLGYTCTNKRRISEILHEFFENHIERCIEEAAATNGWIVDNYHLTHKGIYGDRHHSSRSLHSEGRAIDIGAITVTRASGKKIKLDYKTYSGGKFYSRLRACWGKTITRYNNCPAYNGMTSRTGSIGAETRSHKSHLHLSVPYCISGRYAGSYFRR